MRIFVTGASGFIGSAVVETLLKRGHHVVGLARSDAAAEQLNALGAEVTRGSLEDIASLQSAAEQADGIIHTAFVHDFSRFQHSVEVDQRAINGLGDALAGSNKPLIVTSGTMLLPLNHLATEQIPTEMGRNLRAMSDMAALALVERGIRSALVRLPPTVHGAGDHGFIPMLIALAKQNGVVVYIDEGENLWPAVHRYDAAKLFCLAVERAAAGTSLHAVQEQGVSFKQIAEVIGAGLNLPVKSVTLEEAPHYLRWMTHFVAANNPTSSRWTQETLGWLPSGPDLLSDLRNTDYF